MMTQTYSNYIFFHFVKNTSLEVGLERETTSTGVSYAAPRLVLVYVRVLFKIRSGLKFMRIEDAML